MYAVFAAGRATCQDMTNYLFMHRRILFELPEEMAEPPTSKLFQPIQVGDVQLAHRVVHAPLTRLRVDPTTQVILPFVREYYEQRASTPGTLLIGEGTLVAHKAGAYLAPVTQGPVSGAAEIQVDDTTAAIWNQLASPGIWSAEQIRAWREVTDAVHAKGSFIYCQLFAMGRAATTPVLADPNVDFDLVSASAIPLPGETITPRALTVPEVQEYVQLFVTAAENAVNKADFDGVEIHGANGYLLDAFLQDTANQRSDAYGGSIENRARMFLEIVSATAKSIGESKVGVRLSPWSPFQGMLMEDPIPTFSYVVESLRAFPTLAYLHIIEPRVAGNNTVGVTADNALHSNDFVRKLWRDRTLLSAGGYTRETAMKRAETGEIVVFGRAFLANPDLPVRLMKDIPLTPSDRKTYYVPTPEGYTSYPFVT